MPSGVAQSHGLCAGVALLDRLRLVDDIRGRADEETAGLHRAFDRRQLSDRGEPRVARRRDLLLESPLEAQVAEHLYVLS